MGKYMIFLFLTLFIATLLLYMIGGLFSVIGAYIGAFLEILLMAICFALVKGIVFICDLID